MTKNISQNHSPEPVRRGPRRPAGVVPRGSAPTRRRHPTKPLRPSPRNNPPFHGNLKAVDTSAKTLTVGTLTLQITSDTKITKDGKPATLADGVVGEPVSGAYTKTADGKLNAVVVHFGAKPKKHTSAN